MGDCLDQWRDCGDNAKVKTLLISMDIPRPPPGMRGPWLQMTSALNAFICIYNLLTIFMYDITT